MLILSFHLFLYLPCGFPFGFFFVLLLFFIPYVLSSTTRKLGSRVRIPFKAWMCVRVFLCCVVLCVGEGLVSGWSPVQGVLPNVQINSQISKLKFWIGTGQRVYLDDDDYDGGGGGGGDHDDVCHIFIPSVLSTQHPNNIWWSVQIMRLLIL